MRYNVFAALLQKICSILSYARTEVMRVTAMQMMVYMTLFVVRNIVSSLGLVGGVQRRWSRRITYRFTLIHNPVEYRQLCDMDSPKTPN